GAQGSRQSTVSTVNIQKARTRPSFPGNRCRHSSVLTIRVVRIHVKPASENRTSREHANGSQERKSLICKTFMAKLGCLNAQAARTPNLRCCRVQTCQCV